MFSGETSKGKYPVLAVKEGNNIIDEAERFIFDPENRKYLGEKINELGKTRNISDIIGSSAHIASKYPNIRAMVVPTHGGTTVTLMATKYENYKPIIAICNDMRVMRQLNVLRGVIPIYTDNKDESKIIEDSIRRAKEERCINPGDDVIITGGVGSHAKGETNMMRIETV
jgi:pyruvate kinase